MYSTWKQSERFILQCVSRSARKNVCVQVWVSWSVLNVGYISTKMRNMWALEKRKMLHPTLNSRWECHIQRMIQRFFHPFLHVQFSQRTRWLFLSHLGLDNRSHDFEPAIVVRETLMLNIPQGENKRLSSTTRKHWRRAKNSTGLWSHFLLAH